MPTRSLVIPLMTVIAMLAASLATAQDTTTDTPPDAPGAPRATFYDGAGGEVFWQRANDDGGVLAYEVSIDGRVVATRDATSYYNASLDDERRYDIAIVAIDTVGQRSMPARVTLGARPDDDDGGMPIDGERPPAPGNLRVVVYSPGVAELFWDRVPGRDLRYEVIDASGNPIDTTSGTSAFFGDLEPGTRYDWQVVATGSDDSRSGPVAIRFRTDRVGTFAADEPGNAPAIAPRDLRLDVYSSTFAELFWTPFVDPTRSAVIANEIRRDGVLLATLSGRVTRSFIDDDREPGRDYAYEVTAIRADGTRASARLADAGAPPAAGPEPEGDALPDALARAIAVEFEVINVVAMERLGSLALRITGALRTGEAESLGLVFDATEPLVGGREQVIWRCPGGGRLLQAEPSGQVGVNNVGAVVVDCAIGSLVLNGYFSNSLGDSRGGRRLFLSGLVVDDASDLSTLSVQTGRIRFFPGEPAKNRVETTELVVERPIDPYRVQRLISNGRGARLPNGERAFTIWSRGVTGGLAAGPGAAPDSDVDDSAIETTGAFTFTETGLASGQPLGGRLLIRSGVNSLNVDALTEDPTRVRIIADVDGSTTSYDLPWSDTVRVRPIDVERGADLGL